MYISCISVNCIEKYKFCTSFQSWYLEVMLQLIYFLFFTAASCGDNCRGKYNFLTSNLKADHFVKGSITSSNFVKGSINFEH